VSDAALILVRHAEPAIDPTVPSPQWRLSERGRAGAAALAERLAAFAAAAAVASSEPKALETVQIVAGQFGLPVAIDDGFAEHHRPGLPFSTPEERDAQVAKFFADPGMAFFGGESADQARERFAAALARHTARPLLVGSHGTVLAFYLSRLLGLDAWTLWKSIGLPEAFVLDGEGRLLERIAE
jgi:broad specificity phosphatase PhoE